MKGEQEWNRFHRVLVRIRSVNICKNSQQNAWYMGSVREVLADALIITIFKGDSLFP